jgi:hypothetical protein
MRSPSARRRSPRACLTTYSSAVSDEDIATAFYEQGLLEYALANVEPTDELIAACYRALAAAGVEALPVEECQVDADLLL